MVVPPRTLVAGVPAKVRRELGAEELEHLRRGVRSYLEIKARYLAADDERELGDGSEMWREA
jgi:carbonic anhydrase/acetyltransferase-like protein (isoleucine patch superfamily)